MSQTEIRRFFDAVATGGPPTGIDVDAAMNGGRRRRRRRAATVALSAATAVAVVGVVVVTAMSSQQSQPPTGLPSPTPTGGQPSASESPLSLAGQGILVTSTDQLLGSWWAMQLDGQDVEAVRDRNGDPLVMSVSHWQGRVAWSANDGCNNHSGWVKVSPAGRLTGRGQSMTAVACLHADEYPQNPGSLTDSDQARILPAEGSSPKRLVLLNGQRVLGVYAFVPDAKEHLGYGTVLTSGAGDGEGMAAEVRGRLTLAKDNCLGLDGDTAVFPQGTTWSGALGFLILPGGSTAHLGDVLSGGGGYLEPAQARTWVEDKDLRGICTLSADVPVFNKGSDLTVAQGAP